MIIYCWNSKLLKHAPLENVECESCNQKSTQIGIHSNYFHIFWIPVFPYSKKASIVCTTCSHVTGEKKMPENFKNKVKALKGAVPTPKYHFAGLAIIAALVVYFTFENYNSDVKQQNFLQAPLAGDVYILKDNEESSEYKYYLLKVKGLEEDSLRISYNSFAYNKLPMKLDEEDGFYDFTSKIAKSEILDMVEKGEIKKVIRSYDALDGYDRTIQLKEAEYVEEIVDFEEDKKVLGSY